MVRDGVVASGQSTSDARTSENKDGVLPQRSARGYSHSGMTVDGGFGGGVMIATSKSSFEYQDNDGGWPSGSGSGGMPISSDAEATLSLLQVDDEYDARHHLAHSSHHGNSSGYQGRGGGGGGGGGYRHYTPSSQSGGDQLSPVRNGGRCTKALSSSGAVGATAGSHSGSAPVPDTQLGASADVDAACALAVLSCADSDDASELWQRRAQRARGSDSTCEGLDGGEAPMRDDGDGPDSVAGMMGDDIHWRVDFEEEEARARLEKALRDQQRFRQEELMELQRVYTKALRKNFRSIKRMPEPSFDTPTALFEEELDALEEMGDGAAAGQQRGRCQPPPYSDGLGGSLSSSVPSPPSEALQGGPLGSQHQRRCFVGPTVGRTNAQGGHDPQPKQDDGSLVDRGDGGHSVDAYASLQQMHADCQDEHSMVVHAMRGRHDTTSGAGIPAAVVLPFEGTHIHTTHGGGTHGSGGVAASGFVHRLRRRTDAGEEIASLHAYGGTKAHDDE